MDPIREIVERLLRDSNALAVRLMFAEEYVTEGDDRLLPLEEDLQRLLGDREMAISTSPISLHVSRVSKDALLVVVFDMRSSLGLVRLRVKKATEDLRKAIASGGGSSSPASAALAASPPRLKADS